MIQYGLFLGFQISLSAVFNKSVDSRVVIVFFLGDLPIFSGTLVFDLPTGNLQCWFVNARVEIPIKVLPADGSIIMNLVGRNRLFNIIENPIFVFERGVFLNQPYSFCMNRPGSDISSPYDLTFRTTPVENDGIGMPHGKPGAVQESANRFRVPLTQFAVP